MIAIPNMSKPKDCEECKFCIVEAKVEGKIYPLNAYRFVQHQNLKDFDECPLIEIDEPKVGRWIPCKWYFGKDKKSWTDEVKCSECGELGEEEYSYCPYCGAKMERRADECIERSDCEY